MESGWDDQLGLFRWGTRELWEDVAELFFVGFRDRHPPEAILYVKFAEEDGALVNGAGSDSVDDAAEGVAQLVHGFCRGCSFIGKFIDRELGVAESSLSFVGQIEDHTKKSGFVRYGSNGTYFSMLTRTIDNLLAQLGPCDQFGKSLGDFL